MKRALGLSLLAALLAAAGCGERHMPIGANGVRQTKLPGHVAAGGHTSGEVMAAKPAAAPSDVGPAGTPGIPQGSGGNTSGAALGGTSTGPGGNATAPTPRSGVGGVTGTDPASGTGATGAAGGGAPGAPGTPGVPGAPIAAGTPGTATGSPGLGAGVSPAERTDTAGTPAATGGSGLGGPGTTAGGAGTAAAGLGLAAMWGSGAAGRGAGSPTPAQPPAPPSPALVGAAAAAAAPPGTTEAQRQQIALAASMDVVANRWRTRAAAQGWPVNAPTPVDAQGGVQASAMPAPPAAPLPIRSEKLGTAPLSPDVKTGQPAGRRPIGEKAPDAVPSREGTSR